MNSSRTSDMIRRPLMLMLVMVIAAGSIVAAGPPRLSIRTVRHLTFGKVACSSTTEIEYSDMRAGQFVVEGKPHMTVRLTVSASELKNDGLEIPLTLAKERCAYSTDGGTSWYLFSTGQIFQDVKFPGAINNSTAVIHVRVGGSLTVGPSISRGSYVGGVTLNASYLDMEDNDDDDD